MLLCVLRIGVIEGGAAPADTQRNDIGTRAVFRIIFEYGYDAFERFPQPLIYRKTTCHAFSGCEREPQLLLLCSRSFRFLPINHPRQNSDGLGYFPCSGDIIA